MIKYFKIRTPLLFVVIILFTNSCGTKSTAKPHYKMTDEFKLYCMFQPESSWQYYNSLLNDTTTIILNTLKKDIWHNNVGESYSYEAVNMFFIANSLGISTIQLTAGSTVNSTNPMNSLMRIFYDNGDYRLVFDAKYPLGEEQIIGENEGIYENVEVISNMELHGHTYSNVYHTRITDFYNQGFGDYDFYIAKYYGIIKMRNIVNNDTIVTELINSVPIQ